MIKSLNAATAATLLFAALLQAQPADEVKLTFANTTDKPVDIYFVKRVDGKDEEKLYKKDLASDFTIEQTSSPGQIWRARKGETLVCQYEATRDAEQVVDIFRLALLQAPVDVIFQNTSNQTVDIYFVDVDGNEQLYAGKLPAGKQHKQEASGGQVWRIRSDGKLVAEYVPDQRAVQPVNIGYLMENFRPPVTLNFQNTTARSVTVLWVNLNDEEIPYGTEIASGKSFTHDAYPFQVWRVRDTQSGALVLEFVPAESPQEQSIDVAALSGDEGIATTGPNTASESTGESSTRESTRGSTRGQ